MVKGREDREERGWHVTAERLRELAAGEIDAEVYLTLLLEHLGRLCPDCGLGLAGHLSGHPAEDSNRIPAKGATDRPGRPDRATERTVDDAIERALGFRDLETDGAGALAALLALPAQDDRLRRIAAEPERHRNPALGEMLLDRARVRVHDSPAEAAELAELAAAVARLLPDGPYGPDFCRDRLAEALAHRANAVRAQGDLRRARTLLREAAELAADSVDPFVRAELASFTASLARAQRRWAEALDSLDEAERIFLEIDASFDMIARVRLKRASVLMLDGDARAAAEVVRDVIADLERIDREERRHHGTARFDGAAGEQLHFIACHNLVVYLCEAGEHRQAAELMDRLAPILDGHRERSFRLRGRWLRGKIAHGTGDRATAVSEMTTARDGFLAAGLGLDAAVVALDLAIVHAEERDHAAVREIAAWTNELFRTQDVHPEALTALGLFRQAAFGEALGAAEIRRVAHYLHSVRTGPTVRYDAVC